jgi:hypothetical protein
MQFQDRSSITINQKPVKRDAASLDFVSSSDCTTLTTAEANYTKYNEERNASGDGDNDLDDHNPFLFDRLDHIPDIRLFLHVVVDLNVRIVVHSF